MVQELVVGGDFLVEGENSASTVAGRYKLVTRL